MGKSTISMAIFHCYVSSPEGTYRIHLSWFSSFTRDFQKRGSEEPNFPIDSAAGGFRNCLPYFWICYMAMILTWVEWVRVWFKLGLFTHTVWLVVDLPLWKMMEFVSWEIIPNIWENKKCSKAPTSSLFTLVLYLSELGVNTLDPCPNFTVQQNPPSKEAIKDPSGNQTRQNIPL